MALPMLSRRLFGLIAAYAIALQAVLAIGPLVPVAGHSAAVLCAAQDGTSLPAAPGEHGDLQCCVAAGCHAAPAITPQTAIAAPARYADRAELAEVAGLLLTGVAAGGPHWPRAPPV